MTSLLLVMQRMTGLTLCAICHLTMTCSIHCPMITWFTNLYLYFCPLQNSMKFHLYLVPPQELYVLIPLLPSQELPPLPPSSSSWGIICCLTFLEYSPPTVLSGISPASGIPPLSAIHLTCYFDPPPPVVPKYLPSD